MRAIFEHLEDVYRLNAVLLIYQQERQLGQGTPFITYHGVTPADIENGLPSSIGPAQPLQRKFLKSLARSMSPAIQTEFLPENVLARDEYQMVWWAPVCHRPMLFNVMSDKAGEYKALSGKTFPHPALLFSASRNCLSVRALRENKRPAPSTELMVAPYWNVSENGYVCLGSMKHPKHTSVTVIPGWENGFFDSAFSHPNTPLLTLYPKGLTALWKKLADSQRAYPVHQLVPAKQSLRDFLKLPL